MFRSGLYLDFDGTIGRGPFWLANIVLLVAMMAVYVVVMESLASGSWHDEAFVGTLEGARVNAYAMLLACLVLLWPSLAVSAKRLRDRARPQWLLWVFFAPGFAWFGADIAGLTVGPHGLTPLNTAFEVSGWAICAWWLIELGFLPGRALPLASEGGGGQAMQGRAG